MSALTALAEPQVTASGTVSALAAITGVEDQVGDLIMPGAFAGTLRRLRPKIVDAHDWRTPVGRVTDIVELRPGDRRLPQSTPDGQAWPREAVALLVRGVFNLATAAGRTAAANAQFYTSIVPGTVGVVGSSVVGDTVGWVPMTGVGTAWSASGNNDWMYP